jgi:D-lyxose ketol-isomerase
MTESNQMTIEIQMLQLSRPWREQVAAACRTQLDAWRVVMPEVEPLVLDFGLGEFNETGLVEFWIANESKAGYCGKYLFNFDGQRCPRHQHRVKHETFFIVEGCFEVTLDEERQMMTKGQTLAIPPGHSHGFRGVGPALLLELSMPCDVTDNYFDDPRINQWLRRAIATPPSREK